MHPLRILSSAEQVAAFLRERLVRGLWRGKMPGVMQLAEELGVSRTTVETALRQLEREGLLVAQGPGRRRQIVSPGDGGRAARSLRVAILLHDTIPDRQLAYIIDLQHELEAAGHTPFFPAISQVELKSDLARIRRFVDQTPADAWVVVGGTREVVEWFSARPVPSFALFGRRSGLPIAAAGPDKAPAFAAATRELIGLGHHRISLLCRKLRRLPEPGRTERAFLKELAAHKVPTGPFNLPDWEESVEGFHACLTSLFRITPPTALILDEPPHLVAAQQFLAGRGMRVPQDVSIMCTDHDVSFAWCKPTVSHIRWNSAPVIRRVVRWARTVSRGREDLKQMLFPAEFVAGGTIGPAPPD